jgi:hypothetical protein
MGFIIDDAAVNFAYDPEGNLFYLDPVRPWISSFDGIERIYA